MSVLTEKEALSRASTTSLLKIKKLNCWGSDLSDISLVRQMPNLEVLNLSANNIVSLKDIAFCSQLKELYLRKNYIKLEEIKHLKNLPNLEILWLTGNPCTEEASYKETILLNLPSIKKLDSILVTQDDLELAKKNGRNLDFETIIYNPQGFDKKQIGNIEKQILSFETQEFDEKQSRVIENLTVPHDEKKDVIIENQTMLENLSLHDSVNDHTLVGSAVKIKVGENSTEIFVPSTVSFEPEHSFISLTGSSSTTSVASSIDLEQANERRKALGLKLLDIGIPVSLSPSRKNDDVIKKPIFEEVNPTIDLISMSNCEEKEESVIEETNRSIFSNPRSNTLSAVILLLETLSNDELEQVVAYADNLLRSNHESGVTKSSLYT